MKVMKVWKSFRKERAAAILRGLQAEALIRDVEAALRDLEIRGIVIPDIEGEAEEDEVAGDDIRDEGHRSSRAIAEAVKATVARASAAVN